MNDPRMCKKASDKVMELLYKQFPELDPPGVCFVLDILKYECMHRYKIEIMANE